MTNRTPSLFPRQPNKASRSVNWCFQPQTVKGEKRPPLVKVATLTPTQTVDFHAGLTVQPSPEQQEAFYGALAGIAKAQATGRIAETGAETLFSVLAAGFLNAKKTNGDTQKSINACKVKLDDFCNAHPTVRVQDISPAMVNAWVADHSGWRTPESCNGPIKIVKAVLNWGIKQEFYSSHRCGKALPLRPAGLKKDYLVTADDEAAIQNYTSSAFNKFFRFCLLTGCRPSEAARITARDVIEIGGRLTVILYKHKTVKKTGKPRNIQVFNPEAIELLKEGMKAHTSGCVFRSRHGKSFINDFDEGSWVDVFGELHRAGKVNKRFTMYCTRHTFINKMLLKGVPMAFVSECVGNSVAILEKHYSHLATQTDAMLAVINKLLAN